MKALFFFAGGIAFAASLPPQITYHKDVAPILQSHCQECHRPGEIAPFSLLTYKDARPWAKSIKEAVLTKKMPPWFADPNYGHFANDRTLSKAEVDTLTNWVDSGAREGDAKDEPAALHFVKGWNIRMPDQVISLKEPVSVPATGEIPYQYIVMPTGLTEDRWVQQVEVRPSDRTVVHHVVVFIRDKNSKWLRDAQPGIPFVPPGGGKDFVNTSGGGSDVLTIYTPGMIPETWKPGTAKLLPAGADLVFQVHYTVNGKATQDLSKIGIVFAPGKPELRALTAAAYNLGFKIPPEDPHYPVTGKSTFPNGATLMSLFPHMHLRGKSFEYQLVYPDGHAETLLKVPSYDFFWQLDYRLANPIIIPPGAKLIATGWFDNSPNNPKNPDPTKEVRFGEQSWEEMMFGFFDITFPSSMTMKELFTPPKKAEPTQTKAE